MDVEFQGYISGAASKDERVGCREGRTALYVAIAGLSIVACTGSETGNAQTDLPERPVSIRLALGVGESGALVSTSADGFVVTAEEGTAWVDSVELGLAPGERCSDDPVTAELLGAFFHPRCAGGKSLRIDGPWEVDLRTGRFDPPLEGLSLPEVELADAEVKLRQQGSTPAIEVLGSVEDRDFEFALLGAVPAKFTADRPVLIDDGLGRLRLDLDFGRWFSEVALGPCLDAQPPGGAIVLTRSACSGVEQVIRRQLVSGKIRAESR